MEVNGLNSCVLYKIISMLLLYIVVSCVLCQSGTTLAQAVTSQWDESCIWLSHDKLEWQQAIDKCYDLGGRPLALRNESDLDPFLDGSLPGITSVSEYWVFLRYHLSPPRFEWATGEAVEWNNWKTIDEDVITCFKAKVANNHEWEPSGHCSDTHFYLCEFPHSYCPCTHVQTGSLCYWVSHEAVTWHAAVDYCQSYQGMLINIDTPEVEQFLSVNRSQIEGGSTSANHWIGFSDLCETNTYQWIGQMYGTTNWTNWRAGKPDSLTRHCVAAIANDNYRWEDRNCDDNFLFYCVIDTDRRDIENMGLASIYTCPCPAENTVPGSGSCLRGSKVDSSANEARDMCLAMGARLAVVDEDMYNFIITTPMPWFSTEDLYFIGLVRDLGESFFYWVDTGENSTWPNWQIGEPTLNDRYCGAGRRTKSHQWESRRCTDTAGYLCEFPADMTTTQETTTAITTTGPTSPTTEPTTEATTVPTTMATTELTTMATTQRSTERTSEATTKLTTDSTTDTTTMETTPATTLPTTADTTTMEITPATTLPTTADTTTMETTPATTMPTTTDTTTMETTPATTLPTTADTTTMETTTATTLPTTADTTTMETTPATTLPTTADITTMETTPATTLPTTADTTTATTDSKTIETAAITTLPRTDSTTNLLIETTQKPTTKLTTIQSTIVTTAVTPKRTTDESTTTPLQTTTGKKALREKDENYEIIVEKETNPPGEGYYDSRTTAVAIGSFGMCILIAEVTVLLILDLTSIKRHLRYGWRNLKDVREYFSRKRNKVNGRNTDLHDDKGRMSP